MNTTSEEVMSDEVQELVWALIDEQATDDQLRRLEELLLEDPEARRVYVMCMQMHADLHYLFNGRRFELPAELQKAMEAEKAQKAAKPKKALPIFEFPAISTDAAMTGGMVS